MTHYLAVIHKEPGSAYGVSFPDVPGVVAAGDTLDEAIGDAQAALVFAADDWQALTGSAFPRARSFEDLRRQGLLDDASAGALIAAIPFPEPLPAAA